MEGKVEARGRRGSYPQEVAESQRHLFQRRRTLSVAEGGSNEEAKVIRAAVLGKDGVGKTAFTVRLLTRRFIGDYDGTLEASRETYDSGFRNKMFNNRVSKERWYQHRIDVDGQDVQLHVFDTAGKNCMEKIDSCSTLDLLFVLYSITDRSSFQEATLIIKYLLETKNFPASTIFLIASKADLKRHTEVTEFEGRLFAVNSGCLFHQLSNSDGFSEHCSIVRKAFLAVSSVGAQRPPKSPLIRRLKDGFKTKVYGGSSHDHVDRKRSASVEF